MLVLARNDEIGRVRSASIMLTSLIGMLVYVSPTLIANENTVLYYCIWGVIVAVIGTILTILSRRSEESTVLMAMPSSFANDGVMSVVERHSQMCQVWSVANRMTQSIDRGDLWKGAFGRGKFRSCPERQPDADDLWRDVLPAMKQRPRFGLKCKVAAATRDRLPAFPRYWFAHQVT